MFIIFFFFFGLLKSTKKKTAPDFNEEPVEILFLCDPRTIRGQINVRLKGAAAVNASVGAVRIRQNGKELT